MNCTRFPCGMTTGGHCPTCNPLTMIVQPAVAPPRRALWEYTDDEIAREYHNRALKKLGDPRIGVGFAGPPDHLQPSGGKS